MIANTIKAANLEKSKKRVLWIVVLIFCFGFSLVLNQSKTIPKQSDLYSRWYAARMLFQEGRSLYDPLNGLEVAGEKYIPTSRLEAGFYYPAYLLVLIGPLAFLDFPLAHLIWTFAGLVMFVTGVWKASVIANWPAGSNRLAVIVLLSLLFIPVMQHTIWSQFDTIAVMALMLSLDLVRKKKYLAAGMLGAGLVFKPQGSFVVLVFLLGWAAVKRIRWAFLAGFGLACGGLLGISMILEPGWVYGFVRSLQEYQQLPYQIRPVIDQILNLGMLSSILLLVGFGAAAVHFRNIDAIDKVFTGMVLISLGVNWLVVPVIGMLYLVMFPCALILLMGGLANSGAGLKYPVWILGGIYLGGILGFILPLAGGGHQGMHILLAELAYKITGPIVLILLSIYLIKKRISI